MSFCGGVRLIWFVTERNRAEITLERNRGVRREIELLAESNGEKGTREVCC